LPRKLAAGGVVVIAAALAAALAGCTAQHGSGPPAAAKAGHAAGSAVPGGPATFQGPDGAEARWVIEENDKPGSTAWRIRGPHGGIEGFANQVYVRAGQRVTLYVSTAGPRFRAEAFRMGYYQGKGARLIWESGEVAGRGQPGCPVATGTNMVACDNWKPSLTFTVTRAWVQGDYLIKLVGSGHAQSYVPLTVWDPASTATYVIKNDVFTWQAWNPYGGYDYYQGLGSCPAGGYPLCSRSKVVSYDRPYAAEDGSGNFLVLEYPLVRWAEKHGLDVTYATDLTVQEHPGYLLKHKVLLSLGHDECWSYGEREAAVRAYGTGMNIVFFAASPILRHVRTQASPLGQDRELVDYRDSAADPLDSVPGDAMQVTGNEWSSPPSSWPEYDFVGDTYSGFLEPGSYTGFRVADASAWVFAGTGLKNGEIVPGVVGSDTDEFQEAAGQPADDQIFGHSPVSLSAGQHNVSPWFSDMTYYTNASTGAGVIDSGTNNWIPALDHNAGCGRGVCESTVVSRVTGNIMKLFGEGPAARHQPSVANWRQVTGQ
jgi:hypothetical protein